MRTRKLDGYLLHQQYSTVLAGNTSRTTIPKWMKDLEKNQGVIPSPSSLLSRSKKAFQNRQKELEDQIILYEAVMRDDFSGSPNRIGISIIGLLVVTGLIANQIRHHGAGPVWYSRSNPFPLACCLELMPWLISNRSDPKSAWLDFELKLWDPYTRMFFSMSLITFSVVKSLKFAFTLSHTIKRITIKKKDLNNLQRIISSKKNKPIDPSILNSVPMTLYSIGSLDLIYPIRKLYEYSILETIRMGDMIRLSQPIASQNQASSYQRSLWLKFCVSSNDPPVNKLDQKRKSNFLNLAHLNTFALQIPAVGVWGNSKFDLRPLDILSLFEEKIKSVDDLIPQQKNHTPQRIEEEDHQLRYKLFGLDFRHSLGFNLSVIKVYLSDYYRFLSSIKFSPSS
ncbi:hypothetical protein PSHT_11386 [Puccinia striiformis]|uniref:Uncharacterized protein n=1 Tax=Puccinia striiformis TaxID=27350 RepID=A0A2S4V3L4_9BASI|nr:hypothetical protein PSHT_11386 [Puccinia striiformis]